MMSPSPIFYFLSFKTIRFHVAVVCTVIDHRRHQMVKTSVTHSTVPHVSTLIVLTTFRHICDILLNTCTDSWNLFVTYK